MTMVRHNVSGRKIDGRMLQSQLAALEMIVGDIARLQRSRPAT